jgi:hypothetical protein
MCIEHDFCHKELWHSFDLLMTPKGFSILKHNFETSIQKAPQVYVHKGLDGPLKNKILRVGKAKKGAIDRWFNQTWGHSSTFLWSIGESRRYASYAKKYPNYLLFFAGLFELRTKLYVFSCQSIEDMNQIEKIIIHNFCPVWESYKKNIKSYFTYNPVMKENASKYGIAKSLISNQRKENMILLQGIPDVIQYSFIEQKEWCLD